MAARVVHMADRRGTVKTTGHLRLVSGRKTIVRYTTLVNPGHRTTVLCRCASILLFFFFYSKHHKHTEIKPSTKPLPSRGSYRILYVLARSPYKEAARKNKSMQKTSLLWWSDVLFFFFFRPRISRYSTRIFRPTAFDDIDMRPMGKRGGGNPKSKASWRNRKLRWNVGDGRTTWWNLARVWIFIQNFYDQKKPQKTITRSRVPSAFGTNVFSFCPLPLCRSYLLIRKSRLIATVFFCLFVFFARFYPRR